jgi:ferredoxin
VPSNIKQQKGESIVNLEYHKGSFCIYRPMFCQEGYCSTCEVYLSRQLFAKPTIKRDSLREIRKLESEVATQKISV